MNTLIILLFYLAVAETDQFVQNLMDMEFDFVLYLQLFFFYSFEIKAVEGEEIEINDGFFFSFLISFCSF
jgi:hypothetical protein